MEYINIISKEEIMEAFQPPITVVGCLAIAAMIGLLVYCVKVKDCDKIMKAMFVGAPIALGCLLTTLVICSIFFRVPTGRYKYEATIDKDKITVAQYEAFIEEYDPIIKDGVYYWEE